MMELCYQFGWNASLFISFGGRHRELNSVEDYLFCKPA
jgi:hypothetical protein